MKKVMLVVAGLLIGATVQADQLIGVNRFVCAASQVQICIEATRVTWLPPGSSTCRTSS